MKVFMNVAGCKYVSEDDKALSPSDSEIPVCTKELYDILTIAKRPLSDEQIALCKTAIATAVPSEEDSNVS